MKDLLTELLAYEYWANTLLIKSLATIEDPPARAVSLAGHILSAQQVWLERLMGNGVQAAIWQRVPIDQLREKSDQQYQAIIVWLNQLPDVGLEQEIAYTNSKGDAFQNTPKQILIQLSHHAAYHRGQIMQLIRPQLTTPPALDYIFWVRSR